MQNSISSYLSSNLDNRHNNGLWRERKILDNSSLDFNTNDYLGLATHPKVKQACKAALDKYGFGGKASQLLGGYSYSYRALEEELAEFLEYERVVLFSTGYMANLGVITALFDKDIDIFIDRLSHASLIDGVRSSKAHYYRYRHLDNEHLAKLLNKSSAKNKLVISEGVFSMDGDFPLLTELYDVASKYNAWVMLDDAHGIGVLGDLGRGVIEQSGLLSSEVPILVGTFGKAFGGFGAFVAGNKEVVESLIQFARSYIYTTALPSAVIEAARAGLKIIKNESWRREYLYKLGQKFNQKAIELELPFLKTNTPIKPFLVGDIKRTERMISVLREKNIAVYSIRAPTVPVNTTRLRISLTVNHTEGDVGYLLETLKEIWENENEFGL